MTDYEVTQRIEFERMWEQQAKRQQRENFWKWLMLCAIVVIVMVVALVWAGQLGAGAQRVIAVATHLDVNRVKVQCMNDGDATVEPVQKFGELVVSCGVR